MSGTCELTIVPSWIWSGERPLKRDLTPESKSTKTPSRSQKILYLKDDAVVSSVASSSSPALAFAKEKKPASDCCCCLTFFWADDLSGGEPLRFDDMYGSVEMNDDDAAMEKLLG